MRAIPSALRLAHLASAHPRYEPADCARYHGTLLAAVMEGERQRIVELIRAFIRREGELALCVSRGDI